MNIYEGHIIMQSMMTNKVIGNCEEKELIAVTDDIGGLIDDASEKCSFLGYWKKMIKWHLETRTPLESLLIETPSREW